MLRVMQSRMPRKRLQSTREKAYLSLRGIRVQLRNKNMIGEGLSSQKPIEKDNNWVQLQDLRATSWVASACLSSSTRTLK